MTRDLGPEDDGSESPPVIAHAVAEAVRSLNLATLPWASGYQWPADVDASISALHVTATRLTQTLNQAEQWLDRAREAGRIGHDSGGDPRLAVDGARKWLATALTDAGALARSLHVAHQYTARLTGIVPAAGQAPSRGGDEPC